MLHKGRDVGAEKVFALPQADDQWGIVTRGDDNARLVGVNGQKSEGALETTHCKAHCLLQIADLVINIADENGGNGSVGLAGKFMPLCEQFHFDTGKILDDSVVNQRKLTAIGQMRVSVDIGGAAVRRPASVTNAGVSVHQRVLSEFADQRLKFAGLLCCL